MEPYWRGIAPHPDLGETIRAARQARGLSLSQLARRLTVSRRYVCLLQAGKRCPGAAMAGKLQAVLEVPIPMPAIASSELTPRSLGRIRRSQEKARLASLPPQPEPPTRPRFVNGWAQAR